MPGKYRSLWLDMQLALRSVLRQGRRTMIAIIGVSFGVMVLIEASGFIEYLMRGLRESTIRGQLGHVQVVKPGYIKKGSSDPFAFLISGTRFKRTSTISTPISDASSATFLRIPCITSSR